MLLNDCSFFCSVCLLTSYRQFTFMLEWLGCYRLGLDWSRISVQCMLFHSYNECQSISLEVQSSFVVVFAFFHFFKWLTIRAYASLPHSGYLLLFLHTASLGFGWEAWLVSHCSAAGGSSVSCFSACDSGGMRYCTSSVLIATLSGCSQRFRCSNVLRESKDRVKHERAISQEDTKRSVSPANTRKAGRGCKKYVYILEL